jgi:AbrB family looped-hinge helix DNA binding protein
MEEVTVSSKGQIAIPKKVRQALNLGEGSRLTLEVRGHKIVLSKEAPWRKLQGAAGDIMDAVAALKREERERENARP